MHTPSYLNLKERRFGDRYYRFLLPWQKHPQKYQLNSHVHGSLRH